MVERSPAPRLERINDPLEVKRVVTALQCTDSDHLEKVPGAGEIFDLEGVSVQRMHNGILIEEGRYGGAWETEIIRSLRGHHEPQEEVVFDAIMGRLAETAESPRMIEFGSFWAYYSIWFATRLAGAQVLALEPDPANLEVGRRNARLNDADIEIEFLHGAIGDAPGEMLEFTNESDGGVTRVPQFDFDSLLDRQGWECLDLALVDVQGAETILLHRAESLLKAGRVRFLIVSTHHHVISADALTHQRALELIERAGGHVIAEHSVGESFSGDGLIAASFDVRDTDLRVPISYARARDTIFGELEWALDGAHQAVRRLEQENAESNEELVRLRATRLWRWSRPLRAAYSRVRARRA
jgi:FkbM family methyltransferase